MKLGDQVAAGAQGIQAWIDDMPVWRIHVVAMSAGALAALAYTHPGFPPAWAWLRALYALPALSLGLCVLVWLIDSATRRHRPKRTAFGRGWSFAFGHFLSGTYWVGAAFTQVDGALAFMPVGVLGLPAVLAIFWGIGCAAATLLWTDDARRLPVLAAALTGAELLRGHVFGGFPWNLAGYAWEAGGAISQVAAFVGIYGLTALTLLIAVAPATFADSHRAWGARAAPALVAALALGLVWGAGQQRLDAAGPPSKTGAGPVVRVVDPGYSQRDKWRPGREWEVFQKYLELTGKSGTTESEIVVWPEGAIPARYPAMPVLLENPDMMEAIGATLGDRVLIMGATRIERDAVGNPVNFFNTGFVLDAVDGHTNLMQWHDKNRLTPFGEFIPLYGLVAWLNIPTLQEIGTGFTAGDPPTRVVVPGADTALILICYESIFPGLVPRGAERPGWLVNISVDAWFGSGAGPAQNDNQSRYRAIEEGLPMARAASGGFSSITDAYGRKVAAMGPEGGYAEAALPAAMPETINARWGFLLTPALIVLIALLRFAPPGAPARGFRS